MGNLGVNDIYKKMLTERETKRDITSSTVDIVDKAHPKSTVVTDLESELFGLPSDELKKLPMKSLEMFLSALQHLLSRTKEDPMLRGALRRMINGKFAEEEGEGEEQAGGEEEANSDDVSQGEEEEIEVKEEGFSYSSLLSMISEGKVSLHEVRAQKFNYKRLLDIDDKKINDPVFVSILNSFELDQVLQRQQRQGVLIFLKKLAEIAEKNQVIAQSLTKLIQIENQMDIEKLKSKAPVQEESVQSDLDVATILEGLANSDVSPTSILTDFKIGTQDQAKKDALAQTILAYDHSFMDRNAGKTITWKAIEAAFQHNVNYLKQLFQFISKNPSQKEMFAKKVSAITQQPAQQIAATI